MWYPPVTEASKFPTAALSTSGIRVEGDSFLSACQNKLPCIFSCKQKQETSEDASCKKSMCHDFLRRHYPHQVKGSKFGYFLSACSTSSPVCISVFIISRFSRKCNRQSTKQQALSAGRMTWVASSFRKKSAAHSHP